MILLAEIADKMPGIHGLWLPMVIITLPLIGLASFNRYVALVILLIAMIISGFFLWAGYDEVTKGDIADAIWREMGWPWVINMFASACFPFGSVFAMCWIRWRLDVKRASRSAACNLRLPESIRN